MPVPTNNFDESILFTYLPKTVQYSTWHHLPGALLVFDFHFGYRDACRHRFTEVAIEIEFQETINSQFEVPDPRSENNDSEVQPLASVRVLGNSQQGGSCFQMVPERQSDKSDSIWSSGRRHSAQGEGSELGKTRAHVDEWRTRR